MREKASERGMAGLPVVEDIDDIGSGVGVARERVAVVNSSLRLFQKPTVEALS